MKQIVLCSAFPSLEVKKVLNFPFKDWNWLFQFFSNRGKNVTNFAFKFRCDTFSIHCRHPIFRKASVFYNVQTPWIRNHKKQANKNYAKYFQSFFHKINLLFSYAILSWKLLYNKLEKKSNSWINEKTLAYTYNNKKLNGRIHYGICKGWNL